MHSSTIRSVHAAAFFSESGLFIINAVLAFVKESPSLSAAAMQSPGPRNLKDALTAAERGGIIIRDAVMAQDEGMVNSIVRETSKRQGGVET